MSDTDESPAQLAALRPLNMYGYSKHLFDLYAARAGFLDRIVGLKYFNVFGPNEDHKGDMRSLVHKAYGAGARDRAACGSSAATAPTTRDGEQRRDFLYVKDAVAMTLHLAAAPSAQRAVQPRERRREHLARPRRARCSRRSGTPPRIEFIDMPESIRDKYQYHTQADIAKLRATGYDAPVTPLADAVADYVRGYLTTDRRLGDALAPGALARVER